MLVLFLSYLNSHLTQLWLYNMEKNIKIELMKSVDSIKNKIKQIKNQEHEVNLSLDKMFKPVSDPLKTLINSKRFTENIKHDENVSESSGLSESDTNCESTSKYEDFHDADTIFSSSPKNDVKNNLEISLDSEDIYGIYDGNNVPFGIRTDNKTLKMGNSIVSFSKIENIDGDNLVLVKIGDKTYDLTPGLKELLLRKKPDLKIVTNIDRLVYKDILHYTNAHKRDFHPRGQIRGDKGIKYREIIRPLFAEASLENNQEKIGGSLPTLKTYTKNTDLVYWDDPNELVERLKLLIASRDAGNTNHDNEILSIIEELKEANIIKE